MALFTNLFHVGDVLAQMIRDRLGLDAGKVIVGAPRSEPASSTLHVRVSLLWINEQITHRNDPAERSLGGEDTPPPITVTATYLITTYGNATDEAAMDAHELLGNVLRVFHDEPMLRLPLVGKPASGEGKLGVSLVPLTPEALEKLWSSLQVKHRPFALYEVGPVQLKSLKAPTGPRPVVMPGGVRLQGPTPRSRPAVTRVVPSAAAVGGRVRIDGVFDAAPTRVWVGSKRFEGADLLVVDPNRSVSVVLPAIGLDAIPTGVQRVSVVVDDLVSEPIEILVADAVSMLDGPTTLTHAKSAALTLSGRGLAGATAVIAWPDAGVRDPDDVKTLAVDSAADTAVTVGAAKLSVLSAISYRFAVQVGPNLYTPHVVLDVTP
jgi:hypothetical protein